MNAVGLPRARSDVLDAVRGVAVLQVVAYHYSATIFSEFSRPLWKQMLNLSWSGVDLFFVLSGFLIGGILIDNRGGGASTLRTFYIRRALRILPLYAVVVFLVWRGSEQQDILKYLTFTQNIVWSLQEAWPHFSVTWSLAVEEQFYLLLPVLVLVVPPARLPKLLIALALTAPLTRMAILYFWDNRTAMWELLPCRLDTLLLGVFVACVVRDPRLLRVAWGHIWSLRAVVACLAIGFAVLSAMRVKTSFLEGAGLSYMALFYSASLLWLALDFGSRPLPLALRPLCWAGLGAYSMYLFHQEILREVSAHIGINARAAAVAFVLTCGVSFLAWHIVEKPCMRLGRRVPYGRGSGGWVGQTGLEPAGQAG